MGTYKKSGIYSRGFSKLPKKKLNGFQEKGSGKVKLLNSIFIGLKVVTNTSRYLLIFNFFILWISRVIILPVHFLKSSYNTLKREIFSRVLVTFFCFYKKSLRDFVKVFNRRIRFISNLF